MTSATRTAAAVWTLSFIAIFAGSDARAVSRATPRVVVNDRSIALAGAFVKGGRVMVPLTRVGSMLPPVMPWAEPKAGTLQALFRSLHAACLYDGSTQTATVSTGRISGATTQAVMASARVGSRTLSLTNSESPSGQGVTNFVKSERSLRTAPIVVGGTVFVPLRELGEAVGAYVEWKPAQRIAALRKTPPSPAELAAERAAIERVKAMGAAAQQNLNAAAQTLK